MKYKTFVRADKGKLSQGVEYESGARVEIPINKDGTIRWYKDKLKTNTSKAVKAQCYIG